MVQREYWAKAAKSLMRHLGDRSFAKEWLSAGLRADSEPKARSEFYFEAFPALVECVVDMGDIAYRPFNLDPTERFCIAGLAQITKPTTIFEFGTYDGSTTLLLARAVPDARITTLDLPPDLLGTLDWLAEQQLSVVGGVGSKFRDQPESARITQLLGDSRTFDFDTFTNQVGLVLVDGSHEFQCVSSDSENALKMLAPGGMIVWDDYAPQWPGVVRAVDELSSSRGLELIRLLPTELVVYDSSRAVSGS
jgi:predicted O-methyltransferase YrrM